MTRKQENNADQLKRGDKKDGDTYPAAPASSSTGERDAGPVPPEVYTPAEAAELLKVPESWLRKKAAQRAVPCTFLGKHLRFSAEDLHRIVREATRDPVTSRGAPPHRTE
ncbi:excisionase family DNA binding protein [Lipingzhangella halophila]|uniref:Excisionase family DNA binding protein n=1 Tax=Lipingzhangella halophila TaxID=1783352 RepID=A0A7W7RER8_9ACTN|nr:helix-turn-helix domain-containing protein [Lipingzhangella halophila]MBB4930652.1 excisionase family DNA binding protein [Lipingzhangella halophila]